MIRSRRGFPCSLAVSGELPRLHLNESEVAETTDCLFGQGMMASFHKVAGF